MASAMRPSAFRTFNAPPLTGTNALSPQLVLQAGDRPVRILVRRPAAAGSILVGVDVGDFDVPAGSAGVFRLAAGSAVFIVAPGQKLYVANNGAVAIPVSVAESDAVEVDDIDLFSLNPRNGVSTLSSVRRVNAQAISAAGFLTANGIFTALPDAPARLAVRTVATVLLSTESSTLNGSLSQAGQAYVLTAGVRDHFVLAPGQTLYAASPGAATQVSVHATFFSDVFNSVGLTHREFRSRLASMWQ